jgi:hypothetical protein
VVEEVAGKGWRMADGREVVAEMRDGVRYGEAAYVGCVSSG